MLLLKHPQRLSTDIDIVVPLGTDVDGYIDAASRLFPFKAREEDIRIGKNKIAKRHYKFIYESPVHHDDLYILLDVLFEDCCYESVVVKEITNELLINEGECLTVNVPAAESMLGDKLTAFAPHTIGILLDAPNKRVMEIMKQMYDVSSLVDICFDFKEVHRTYSKILEAENSYRGTQYTERQCLEDTINASVCIASRGQYNPQDYSEYVRGIRNLRTHIFDEQYTPELAILRATKIIYLATCIIADEDYSPVGNFRKYLDERLETDRFLVLKNLRKGNPLAYAYVVKADRILLNLR